MIINTDYIEAIRLCNEPIGFNSGVSMGTERVCYIYTNNNKFIIKGDDLGNTVLIGGRCKEFGELIQKQKIV